MRRMSLFLFLLFCAKAVLCCRPLPVYTRPLPSCFLILGRGVAPFIPQLCFSGRPPSQTRGLPPTAVWRQRSERGEALFLCFVPGFGWRRRRLSFFPRALEIEAGAKRPFFGIVIKNLTITVPRWIVIKLHIVHHTSCGCRFRRFITHYRKCCWVV